MRDIPECLISKIMLYNSHDCALIVKEYWNQKIASDLLQSSDNTLMLPHPLSERDISVIDNILFYSSWYPYDIKFYSSEGDYGKLQIIDIDC